MVLGINSNADSTLKRGWYLAKIGEVAIILSGYGFPEKYQGKTNDRIPFFKVRDISTTVLNGGIFLRKANNYISEKECAEIGAELLEKGTIVFAKIGEAIKLNRRAILEQDSLVDNNVMGILPFSAVADNLYAFYFFLTVKLAEYCRATTVPSIRKSDIEEILIPLPPLPEQRRIVAKIEELFTRLDAGVEALRKVKAEIKRYRQAVLKHAFEGRLTEEWRKAHKGELESASVLLERIKEERKKNAKEKYKEFPSVDASALTSLPDGWVWAMLPQLGDLNRGKSKHRPRDDKRLYGGKYPFIQTGDVRNSNGIIESYSQTYNEFGLQQSKLWSEGTLCITIAANIAETAILGISACFPDSIVGFIADEQISKTKYVYFFIKAVKNKLEAYAPATAQKNINLNTLNNLIIPLPPLSEQHKIVEEIERHFSIADGVESAVDQSLKQAERLRQSILKRAFEGKLVPQDPTDEPAEKLLEKIKAEKSKQEMNKKAFKKSSKQKELR